MRLILPAIAGAFAIALVPAAPAQTWTGITASQSWNTSGNWNPGTVPNSATAVVTFPTLAGTFFGTANIASSVQAQSINFSNTTGNYSITSNSGQTLSGVTSITVGSGVTTTQTINLASAFAGNLLFPVGSSLTVTNNAALGSVPTLVIGPSTVIGTAGSGGITFSGTGFTRFSGTIAGNPNGAPGGITKTGTGRLELTGNNGNLTGQQNGGIAVTVSGGTLAINADAALGLGGQTLKLDMNSLTSGGLEFLNGGVNIGRPVLLNFAGRVVSNGTDSNIISGLISGAGGLVKDGTGTLTLANTSNSFTGTTVINAGTLAVAADAALGGSTGVELDGGTLEATATFTSNRTVPLGTGGGTLAVDAGQALTLNGAISGNGSLTKIGAGTLTLSGPNTYTGATAVNDGILKAGVSNALPSGTAVTLANVAGATLDLNGTAQTIGSLAGGGATGGNVQLGGGTLTAGGDNTSTAFAGTISGTTGSTFAKVGTGTQTLTGSGSSLGLLTINAGSVTVGSGSLTLTATSNPLIVGSSSRALLTVSGGATVTSASGNGGAQITIDGPIGTAAVVTGAGSLLHAGSVLNVALVANGSLTVQNGGAVRSDLTVDVATYAGNSASLLVQSGGAVSSVFAGIGNFSGGVGTAIVTGTGSTWTNSGSGFSIGDNETPVGTGSLTVANGGVVTTAGLQVLNSDSSVVVNGGALTAGSVATVLGANPTFQISDSPGGLALTVGTDNSSSTYTGPIADAAGGPGTVNKVGTGTLTLTGRLTNTGGYTASKGTIDFNGALVQPGFGSLTAAAGATILYDTGARVFGGFLRGPGTHTVNGATLTGATSFNSAVINVTGSASFIDFTNGGSLTVAANLASPATMSGFTNNGSGAITIGAASAVNAADFETYGTLTLNPAAVGSGQRTLLTNTGSSPMYFNGGSRTFIGTPATATASPPVAGVDLHGQNLVIAGGLFVNNGFVADSTATPGSVIVDFGALYKGAGTNFVNVITQNGGRVQAGNSPGSMGFGRFVFGPGGVNNYVFAIDDATGAAGPSPDALGHVSGWGLVKAVKAQFGATTSSGDFVWTATPSSKLTVGIDSLVNPTTVGTDVAGLMDHFDPNSPYSWPAVQWAGTYSGPTDTAMLDAATSFEIGAFMNPVAGTFGWSLGGSSLSLTYTPSAVPEPGSFVLVALTAVGLARRHRKKLLAASVGTH
jgi:fibronectin-binding autotransporter adhesin